MNIRDNVKALCKLRGITQKELAAKIGMKENTFNIALGKSSFNISCLEKIAGAFDVTMAELFSDTVGVQPDQQPAEDNAKVLRCPHCGEEIELYVKAL